MKINRSLAAAILAASLAQAASAQDKSPIAIVNLVEMTGAGAIAGTNFNNGVRLAAKEINAAGGILGRPLNIVTMDTQTNAEVAKAKAKEALAQKPYAIMGPVFSDMVLATMDETRNAGVLHFVGGEAVGITTKGHPSLFRTSFTQATAMPQFAHYIKDRVRVGSMAVVWVQNEFGKGGRDEIVKALQAQGIKIVADLPVVPRQSEFSDIVSKIKRADPDAVFLYLNEDESPFLLRALYDQVYDGWILGETTVLGQRVIDVAGEAADGVRGHVGLTPDALLPGVQAFHNNYLREFKQKSDHNGMKGYTGLYILKAATEKAGKVDPAEVAKVMKGLSLQAKDHPGILLDLKYDDKGDLTRSSFIVRVANGRHQFLATLPPYEGGAATPK